MYSRSPSNLTVVSGRKYQKVRGIVAIICMSLYPNPPIRSKAAQTSLIVIYCQVCVYGGSQHDQLETTKNLMSDFC